jgi:endonuclease/exonuclease/phosphatase family metal-dependent hydrolase
MRKAIGTDRRRKPGRVLDVINEIDADVIALQEADRRFGGRGSAVPHDLISGKSGYKPVVFGVSHSRLSQRIPGGHHFERLLRFETRNIGWHGNALLVKNEVEILDFDALELPTLEPRGAVLAELKFGDSEVRVIGMHLDLSGLWRRRQMRAILDAIAARHRPMPTVIMGDTNEWRVAAGCLKDLGEQYRLAPTGPSFHSRRPVAALDRIIVDTDLRIDASGVHHSDAARRASDHLPVWARLGL